jgi:hypothetical protein
MDGCEKLAQAAYYRMRAALRGLKEAGRRSA